METHEELLNRLAHDLPPFAEARTLPDVSQQARAALAWPLEVARTLSFPAPTPSQPDLCPNCDAPSGATRSPYCSDACKEEAAFVRQFRAALAGGEIAQEERQVALGQKLWHVLGGGYPLRQSIAPPSSLKQVWKRTEGRCEICGAPATTIDHTGSG